MSKKVLIKIDELMKKNGIESLAELSEKTNVRRAALSELSNGRRQRIEFDHIVRIAEALQIVDIRDIIDLIEYIPDSNDK